MTPAVQGAAPHTSGGQAVRVSPLDIRKQNFKKVMRGADQEEVRMFLDVVASEFEKVIQDNAMMAERIRTLEARVAEFRSLEESMRNSLVTADRIATESRESSDREARRIVQDAHSRAERILEDARERLQILVREIETLRGKKEVFARRFWTMIEGQIGVLSEHMADMVEVESLRTRVAQMAADARQAALGAEEVAPPARPAAPERQMPRADDRRPEYRDEPDWASSRPEQPSRLETPRRTPEPAPRMAEPAPRAPEPVSRASETTARPVEPISRPAARAPEPAEADVAARRPVPKGLGRLLRGRQASLPLSSTTPDPGPDAGRPHPVPVDEDAPEPERAEGFFEISASEARRRDDRSWFRDDEARDRG
jgi:cell division initiation protein